MTGNRLCDILCEQAHESNFKCTIRSTYAHTGKYLWDEYDKNADMTSDKNNTIVDTDENNSEVEIDQNHNYMYISDFLIENAPDPSSTNEWEESVG